MATATALSDVTNDGAEAISTEMPFSVNVIAEGVAPFIFHRWSCDSIEAKGKAAKGSAAKKSDDLESYCYRAENGQLAIPTEYFRMAVVQAAKFKQDPRSPRKSAMDLFKAALFPTHEYCPLGMDKWDYVDRRRVTVQRNGITRSRPAINTGWKAVMQLQVVLPEYVSPQLLNEVLQLAGRVIGVGDFRPTFGRFQVVHFSVSGDK
jgi:hypothetical protein